MQRASIALALLGGAAVGAVIGYAFGSAPARELGEDASSRGAAEEAGTEELRAPRLDHAEAATGRQRQELSAPPDHAAEASGASSGDASAPNPDDWFDDAVRAFAAAGLREGWASVRSDAMPEATLAEGLDRFEVRAREMPARIGAELGRELTKHELVVGEVGAGAGIDLLGALQEPKVGPLHEVVRDFATFESLYSFQSGGEVRDAAVLVATQQKPELVDGETLVFPSGIFDFDPSVWSHWSEFPRDVTFAGSGMDATLLVFRDFSVRARLTNLRFQDCTIYTANSGLVDLRSAPASMRFDRVRVVGFDSGAGGSSLLYGPKAGLLVHFVDCVVEGGYGRRPELAALFDVRSDALLARFDRCQLVQVNLEPRTIRPGSTVHFYDCSLRDLLDRSEASLSAHAGLRFERSPITFLEGGSSQAVSKDLRKLFPAWKG